MIEPPCRQMEKKGMGVGALQPDVETLASIAEPERGRVKTVEGGGAPNSTSPLVLQPLNTNVSFRDQAYAALKQAIMEADIYAHDDELRLDERQLSQALGVSRTPIREAMTLLEQEGFLRTLPRRGVFIIRKTRREIVEMVQVWAALESLAARLATQRATDREIAGLRAMMAESLVRQHTLDLAAHVEKHCDFLD